MMQTTPGQLAHMPTALGTECQSLSDSVPFCMTQTAIGQASAGSNMSFDRLTGTDSNRDGHIVVRLTIKAPHCDDRHFFKSHMPLSALHVGRTQVRRSCWCGQGFRNCLPSLASYNVTMLSRASLSQGR